MSNNSSDFSINFDFSKCNEGKYIHAPHPLGSISLKVQKSKEDICVVEYSSEVEGGWTKYYCKVPKSLGKFETFNQIEDYCIKKASGNLLMQSYSKHINLPNGQEVMIPGSAIIVSIVILILLFVFWFIKKKVTRKNK